MNKDQEISQLIELYLNGELSGKQLADFETQIENDASLAQEIELEQLLRGAVIDAGLMDWKQSLNQEAKSLKQAKRVRNTAIVSGLLILAGIGYWFMSSTDPKEKEISVQEKNNKVEVVEQVEGVYTIDSVIVKKQLPVNVHEALPTVQAQVKDVISKVESPKKVEDTEVVKIENTKPKIKETIAPQVQSKTNVDPCEGVSISAKVVSKPTCEGESKGELFVVNAKGGKAPYQYQLSNATIWQSANSFVFLSKGKYTVTIKDSQDCVNNVKLIGDIVSENCYKPAEGFNPNYETWIYKMDWEGSTQVEIYNKAGLKVFATEVEGDFEWNARDISGAIVPSGLYRYIFVTSKGKKISSTVTVIY